MTVARPRVRTTSIAKSHEAAATVLDGKDRVRRWGEDFGGAPEYNAAVEILRASRTIHHGIARVLKKYDLSMLQWTILSIVYFSDERRMPLGKIAELISVHTTTVSNAIDYLEALRWMTREPLDRRTILAILTKAGTERLRKVQRDLVASSFGISPVSRADLEAVGKALAIIKPRD